MNDDWKISTQMGSSNLDAQAKKLHILSDIAARREKKRKRNKRKILLIMTILLSVATLVFGIIFLLAKNTYTVSFYINSKLERIVEVDSGELLTQGDIPLTRQITGLDFVDWFTNQSGDGEPFNFTTQINNNLSLYAVYKPKVVTIQVYLNDETESLYPLIEYYGNVVDILNSNFINDNLSTEYQTNYQLIGFDSNPASTNPQYKVGDKATLLFDAPLYAIWKGVDVQIQLTGVVARHFNEAPFIPKTLDLSYGENYTVNISEFADVYEQNTGARVIGLLVDGTVYTQGQSIKIKHNMSFQLAFEQNKNNILTIVYNNGISPQTFYGYDRRVLLPGNLTREHYLLNGYNGPLGKVSAGEVFIREEVTYTAIWSGVFYLVELDSQDAEQAGTADIFQKYSEGYFLEETATTSLEKIVIPAKTGYKFLGYFTSPNGEGDEIINATGEIVEQNFTRFSTNTILFAHFETIILTAVLRDSSVGGITAIDAPPPNEEGEYSIVYGESLQVSVQLNEGYTQGYAQLLQIFRSSQHEFVDLESIGSETEPAVFVFKNITKDIVISVPV